MTSVIKDLESGVVSWNYDPSNKVMVYATNMGHICIKSFKLNTETKLQLNKDINPDNPFAAISMDFDLVKTDSGLACILGDYAATVCLIEISPTLVTKVSEFDFKANVNRSIMLKEYSI